ncbi:MAG: LysM peptidoglycan-binding domain-containing protein [Betaproteobacteria bacterium]|nr:LysM peptidoglycan-binding domain-containing protein [Betaproteobacteria bacterium]
MRSKVYKSITTLIFVVSWLFNGPTGAQAPAKPLAIKPDAPARYVVKQGDTLWSIAERYLDAPWRWQELWNLNKDEIKNPNRIYPGNVLVFDRSVSQLVLGEAIKLTPRVRGDATPIAAIESIPSSVIEPFLSRPLVVEEDGLENAPVIVAFEEKRLMGGAGESAFASGLGASKEDTWYMYRRGQALVDPETRRTLGFEAVYLGTARVTRPGEPATLQILTAAQEIVRGDRLIAAGRPQSIEYTPRAPAKQIAGQVIGVYGGVSNIGEAANQSIVTLNRGKANGVEPGNVLALHRQGAGVPDPRSQGASIVLPEQRYGLVFVFRVFENISYALVVKNSRPVQPLDAVLNP